MTGKIIGPSLREVLQLLASGQGDGLVVAKMDRLARSIINAANIIEAAQAQGWSLVVLDLGVDLTTPAGEAMAHMMATFAQFERRLIGLRTKEGLAVKKSQGVRLGRPPVVKDEVVGRILSLRGQGFSYREIAAVSPALSTAMTARMSSAGML